MDELMQWLGGGRRGSEKEADPLAGLLDLLAGAGGKESATGEAAPFAGLLASLLGGGSGGGTNDVAGLAEQAQVTPAVVQAVLALLAGQLARQGAQREAGVDLSALLAQAGAGAELDEATLKASGLPQELTKTAGLDLSAAIKVLQKLLPALAKFLNLPGLQPAGKPKPKPSSAAKPKPTASTSKPKPSSATAKPKPTASTSKPRPSAAAAQSQPATGADKPKPASSTSKPKPSSGAAAKPKPAASTGKPKPTAKPKPRKSEGLPEINLEEPTETDA
ncbi:MAG: hypothetical protein N2439_17210 [Anaerolineae bacterium]|nr:hypothetical protein [Anaerolineae bacterium]